VDQLEQNETSICPACLEPNNVFEAFCQSCGSPIGGISTLDPIQSIQTQGFLFRKAVDERPRLIVVVGMWILFFPALLASVYAAVKLISAGGGLPNFIFFWAFVGLGYASIVILYRVTKNYVRSSTTEKKRRELL
jgi:hypothetical protein